MEAIIKNIVDILCSNIYLLIFVLFSTLLGALGYYEKITDKRWSKNTKYILLGLYILVNIGNYLYSSWKDKVSKDNQNASREIIAMLNSKHDNTYNELKTTKSKLTSFVNKYMTIRNISLLVTYEFNFQNEKDLLLIGKHGLTTTPHREKLSGMYNGKMKAVFTKYDSTGNTMNLDPIILFSDIKWDFEYPSTKALAVKIKFETTEIINKNVELLERYHVLVLPFGAIFESLRRELKIPNPLRNTTVSVKIFLDGNLYDESKTLTTIPFDTNQFVLRKRKGIFYNAENKYMEILGIER